MSKVPNVLRIDGKLYDTQKLANIHPGGPLMVLKANQQDATTLFNSSHRRAFPHEKYSKYQVSETATTKKAIPQQHQDFTAYFDLCEKVKPLLKDGGFAPPAYFVKAAAIIVCALYFEWSGILTGFTFFTSFCWGICLGLLGLNVQHDSNHGAVSRNPAINRAFGLWQNYIGGAAASWMTAHNSVHHVTTNDPERDHDMDIPLLRLKKETEWSVMHRVQQFYFLLLEAGFGPFHTFFTGVFLWTGPVGRLNVLKPYWSTEVAVWCTCLFFRFVVGLCLHPSWAQLGYTAMAYCVGGLYLSFFFLLSHNFEGAVKNVDSTKGDFVKNQAETSCNVGYGTLAQMNGGLNYQIEHHLFPRVHHSYYETISATVRAFCKERGVQYIHYPTVMDNAMSTHRHLAQLGDKPVY